MSQDHDQPVSDASPVSDAIHPEAAPFEPAYQPQTLPQIQVPDLPDDAQGLTAEALAQVPTLTELVDGEPVVPQAQPSEDTPALAEPESDAEPLKEAPEEAPVQETPPQADTWTEQLQVRMGKLSDDIHTLNARLDRLEERNKTKV